MWNIVLFSAPIVGAFLVAFGLFNRQHIWAYPLGIIGTFLLMLGLAELLDLDQWRGAVMPLLIGIIGLTAVAVFVLLIQARRLWKLHTDKPRDDIRANLAIALGAGAGAAAGILLLQFSVQLLSLQQDLRVARESFKFEVALSPDLSGFNAPRDPADGERPVDMSGYWLRGKKMVWAALPNVNLRGSNLVFTDLSGAHMRNVNLSADTDGRKTDLRAASLYWSDLTGAEIGNASFVDADLRKAYLCGTDLRQADLTRADLREAVLDEDPQDPESDCTPAKLPESSKFPEACWPDEIHEVASCGAEARKIVCQRDGQVAQDPKVPECRQPQEGP